jgi:hypothetical protein
MIKMFLIKKDSMTTTTIPMPDTIYTDFCEPLQCGRYSNSQIVYCRDVDYTSGRMVPRIVIHTEGYDMNMDFSQEDINKCRALMRLIHLKAGEPESTIPKTERDILYTDAYCWILSQTNYHQVGKEKSNEYINYILEYTGFESINTMREFIGVVYLPVEFVSKKILPREKRLGLGLLINDGLRLSSPYVQKYVTGEISLLLSKLREYRRGENLLLFNETMGSLGKIIQEFSPGEGYESRYAYPWVGEPGIY